MRLIYYEKVRVRLKKYEVEMREECSENGQARLSSDKKAEARL